MIAIVNVSPKGTDPMGSMSMNCASTVRLSLGSRTAGRCPFMNA